MYSVPRRSVQMFLQAIEQVWHPMHLSRWKTMDTCDLTFIRFPGSGVHDGWWTVVRGRLPYELRKFAHEHVRVAVGAGRPPVIEVVGKLAIPADHEVRLQAGAREAVVPAGAAVVAQRRLRNRIGALR